MFDIISTGDINAVRAELIRLEQISGLKTALTQKTASGGTVLHVAAQVGNLDIMHELVALDVDFDAVDSIGKTALDVADSAGYKQVAALLRTRKEWSKLNSEFKFTEGHDSLTKNVPFNFNRVVKLLQGSYDAVKDGNGKNLTLLLGNTGSGKSTLINYLMGCRYEKSKAAASGKKVAKFVSGREIVAVGHSSSTSMTLYPQVIHKSGLNYVYCDLAGLLDSRGPEERVCAASSTQILTQLGERIKAIIFVMDHGGFTTGRGDLFKKAALALSTIIKGDSEIVQKSVYFVITKAPKNVTAAGIIKEFVEGEVNSLLSKTSLTGDEQARLAVLKLVNAIPDRVIIPNVFDEGQSADQLECQVSTVDAQKTDKFNFVNHDGAQEAFNNILDVLGREFLNRKTTLEETLPTNLKHEAALRATKTMSINAWNEEITDKKVEKITLTYDKVKIEGDITAKKDQTTTNNASITSYTDTVTKQTTEQARLTGLLQSTDTSKNVEVWRDAFSRAAESYREKIFGIEWGPQRPVPGHFDHVFHFNPGYLLSGYEPVGCIAGGNLTGTISGSSFTANFHYARGAAVYASVRVFAQNRHLPGNVAAIAECKKGVAVCEASIDLARQAIVALQQNNQTLATEIENRKNEILKGELDTGLRNGNLDREIDDRTKWITAAIQDIVASEARTEQYNQQAENIKLELEVNRGLFDTVYKVTEILKLVAADLFRQESKRYYLQNANTADYGGTFFSTTSAAAAAAASSTPASTPKAANGM